MKSTFEAAQRNDPQYITILKQLGPFTVPKIEQTEVSNQVFILEELRDEMRALSRLATRRDVVERGSAGPISALSYEFGSARSPTRRIRVTEGSLLQGSNPPVYRIEGGMRRWIPNEQTFEKMGFDWKAIRPVPDDLLELVPRGEDYPSL